jgi:FlaA1/EpsC-like NDP-sugar epimerase
MGEDVTILSVAKRLAQLRGVRVPDDIEIVFTGLRPGERLSERLVATGELPVPTSHPKIYAITADGNVTDRTHWEGMLTELSNGHYRERRALRERLLDLARNGHKSTISGR